MAHRGLTSIPWDEAMRWSSARRNAALVVVAEMNGGQYNRKTGNVVWPEPPR